MTLSSDQRAALRTDGFIVLPGAVPRDALDAALAAINGSIGSAGIPPERLPQFRSSTFCPELTEAPAMLDLFRTTSLAATVRLALGNVEAPRRAQIALRFPGQPATAAVPHIDGVHYPGNGVPPGTLQHFTALGAVFLSDVTGPARGNFTVWPGSHLVVSEHARNHGVAALAAGFPPGLSLGSPVELQARAGDALLAHYLLAHGIAPNLGPHVRYAVFFRLAHARHADHGDRPVLDPWLEWPGVHGG